MPLEASWRLPNGMRSSDVSRGPAAFPDEVACLRVGYQPLGHGSGIFDVCGQFFTPVELNSRVLVEGPLLVLRMALTGSAALQHSADSRLLEESSEKYSLSLLDSSGCIVHHRPDAVTNNLVVTLAHQHCRQLMEGNRIPWQLQRFLDGQDTRFGGTFGLSAAMRRAAAEIRGNPYAGGMASFYRQAKVCDMLIAMLGDLAGADENANRDLGGDRRKAMAARDRLLADLINPPSVELLARQVGLSQRRLNDVFRQQFGKTVLQWVADERLVLAREWLRNGEFSVKEVAWRLGYAFPNNFSKAFTRRFGTSPLSFR